MKENQKHTILYVDDESINLELFEINMGSHFNVITSLSAKEGLKAIEDNPDIEVIISDEKMPVMSGLEFINLAKQAYPEIKYYMLTGFDITPKIKSALDKKFILKCFKKPFDINEMVTEINRCFKV